MGRLKQKLKSEYGASILLALLFFLICGLVTAALLMSAVSNAGKIKNNEESHQKYLTVSSALQMVCEDLLSASYEAKYEYSYTAATQDSDGNPIPEQHIYTQQTGTYDCGMGKYILDELDGLFANQLKADVEKLQNSGEGQNIEWSYTLEGELPNGINQKHTFEVAPPGTGEGNTETVIIEMTLDRTDRSYTINLTAKLKKDEAYAMEAELTPADNKPMIDTEPTNSGNYEIPLNWKLGWITKAE